MVRTKRDNYLRAVQRLGEALEEYAANPTDTVRDGVIQRFEFTFDLAWKSLKEYMQDQGATTPLQFPKQVLREAYAAERSTTNASGSICSMPVTPLAISTTTARPLPSCPGCRSVTIKPSAPWPLSMACRQKGVPLHAITEGRPLHFS